MWIYNQIVYIPFIYTYIVKVDETIFHVYIAKKNILCGCETMLNKTVNIEKKKKNSAIYPYKSEFKQIMYILKENVNPHTCA